MNRSRAAACDFGLSPRLRVSRTLVGEEREPLLVIDGAMRDPRTLVDYAATEVVFTPAGSASGGYPGIRAPAPLNYVNSLVRSLAPVIEDAFSLANVRLARAECNFSLVTLRPDELRPLQRVPHYDTVDPLQFALLHFLCDGSFGGTAFYRHLATGFETVTAERASIFERAREQELARDPPGAQYIAGDTASYRQTASVDAAFDRLLVYRSRILHSGCIHPHAIPGDDPRSGRLTANIFVNYRPA